MLMTFWLLFQQNSCWLFLISFQCHLKVSNSLPSSSLNSLLTLHTIISLDTYRFPANLGIDLIEHVERAKLFAKRYVPPPKKGRKSKATEPKPDANNQDGASSSSASSSDASKDESGGDNGERLSKKKKRKSKKKNHSDKPRAHRAPEDASEANLKKEKEALRIKSAMVNLTSAVLSNFYIVIG